MVNVIPCGISPVETMAVCVSPQHLRDWFWVTYDNSPQTSQCNALLVSKIALVYFGTELQTMAWYNLWFTTVCVYARS